MIRRHRNYCIFIFSFFEYIAASRIAGSIFKIRLNQKIGGINTQFLQLLSNKKSIIRISKVSCFSKSILSFFLKRRDAYNRLCLLNKGENCPEMIFLDTGHNLMRRSSCQNNWCNFTCHYFLFLSFATCIIASKYPLTEPQSNRRPFNFK